MTYPRLTDERIEQIIEEVRARLLADAAKPQPQYSLAGRERGLACFQCGESIKPGKGEVCVDCLVENG